MGVPPSQSLPEHQEDKDRKVIDQKNTAEDPCKYRHIPIFNDPVDDLIPKPKRDGLLADIHRNQHFWYICFIRVHCVSECICQEEECAYLEKTIVSTKPKYLLSRHTELEKPNGKD